MSVRAMNIVEYVEEILGLELLDCQKEMLKKFEEIGPKVCIVFPRWSGRTHVLRQISIVDSYFKNQGADLKWEDD